MSYFDTPQSIARRAEAKVRSLERDLENARKEERWLITQMQNQQTAFEQSISDMQNRITEVIQSANQAVADAKNDMARQIRANEATMAERLQAYREQTDRDIAQMNQRHEQERNQLAQQIAQTNADMQAGFQQIRLETATLMDEQWNNTNLLVNNLRTEMQQNIQTEIQAVENRIINMFQSREEATRQMVLTWLEEAHRLLNDINGQTPAQLIDENARNAIMQQIDMAQMNAQNGMYATALTNAQNAYMQARDLKAESAIAMIRWNQVLQDVRSQMEQLTLSLQSDASSGRYVVTLYGDTALEDNNHDLDYWTYGNFGRFNRELEEFYQTTCANLEGKTTAELEAINNAVSGYMQRLTELQNIGHSNCMMAAARIAVSESVAGVLDDGYYMSDIQGDYHSAENNREYRAVYKNPVNNECAVVCIQPVIDETTGRVVSNHIDLLIDDAANDECVRNEIRQNVQNSLVQEQVIPAQTGIPGCHSRFGNEKEAVRDFSNLQAFAEGSCAQTTVPNT